MKLSVTSLTHSKCTTRYMLDGVFVGVEYKTVIKKAIYNFKYQPYIFRLGEVFSRLMYESLIQNEIFARLLFTSDNVWITCVPLHRKRLNVRGYNQSALLAKSLAEKFGLKSNTSVLIRTKNTIPQFKLKREEREKNITGAFEIDQRYRTKLAGKTLFLVDDLFTSGTTLRECGKLLKKNGAKAVYGLILSMER